MAVTRRTSQRLTLVMLILASITIITLDYRGDARSTIGSARNAARDVLSPIQEAITDILHPIGQFFSGAVNYGSAQSENEALQREIGQLHREIAENTIAEQQLRQLLSQLHLPFDESVPTVQAQVIDQSTSNFQLEIEIDRGTNAGVGVGMPVVLGAGLAGTVVSSGKSTAMVQLIEDPRSSVAVRFGTNQLGAADGAGSGEPLSLQFVQSGVPIKRGQIVYTSGLLGAAYPADIPVGTVSSVQSTPGSPTKTASVTPFVDFSNLQYVTVLQWLPPA